MQKIGKEIKIGLAVIGVLVAAFGYILFRKLTRPDDLAAAPPANAAPSATATGADASNKPTVVSATDTARPADAATDGASSSRSLFASTRRRNPMTRPIPAPIRTVRSCRPRTMPLRRQMFPQAAARFPTAPLPFRRKTVSRNSAMATLAPPRPARQPGLLRPPTPQATIPRHRTRIVPTTGIILYLPLAIAVQRPMRRPPSRPTQHLPIPLRIIPPRRRLRQPATR